MADTGVKFPTSGTSVSETPWSDNAWVNPGSITADDTSYASVTAATYDADDQTYVLKAQGFDFSSIPAGAVIDGVVVVVNAYVGAGGGYIDLAQLLDTTGAKVGTAKGGEGTYTLTGILTDFTFGSSSDLWGNSLTRAWVQDADFGVAIGVYATADDTDVYVDYVTMRVYYHIEVTSSSAMTLGAITSSGTGKVSKTLTGAATLGAVTVAGTAEVSHTATGAITLGAVTSSGSASSGGASAGGPVSLLAFWAGGANKGPVSATGAITLGPIAVAGVAEVTHTSTGAITLGASTVAGTAEVSHTSTGAITLGPVTIAGVSEVTHTSTGAITLGAATVSGTATTGGQSGYVSLFGFWLGRAGAPADNEKTATGAITLGAVTVAGTATSGVVPPGFRTPLPGWLGYLNDPGFGFSSPLPFFPLAGGLANSWDASGAIGLGPVALDGDVWWDPLGAGRITLGAVTVSGTAIAAGRIVSGNVQLSPIEVSGTATVWIGQYGDIVLPAAVLAGVAGVERVTAGAITLGPVAVSGLAQLVHAATGVITLPAWRIASSTAEVISESDVLDEWGLGEYGVSEWNGPDTGPVVAGFTLPAITLSGVATRVVTGTGSITLGTMTVSGGSDRILLASGDIVLPAIVAAGSGKIAKDVTGAITLPAIRVRGYDPLSLAVSLKGTRRHWRGTFFSTFK